MNFHSYKTNFLPPELQCTGLHKIYCLIAGAALLAVIFLCSCWIFAGKCTNLKKELAAARKDIQDLAPAYRSVKDIQKEYTEAEELYREYTAIVSQKQELSEMLLDLNRIAPGGLWLVELEMGSQQQKADSEADSAKEISDKDIIMKGSTDDLSAVGIFLTELGKLPYFQELALDNVTLTSDGMSFQVSASIKEVE